MQAVINFFKKVFGIVRNLFKKVLTLITNVARRGTFTLPQDNFEQLQVLEFIYKALNLVLVLAVLFTGVWLADHGYPSWTALLLFALRFLYAMPAKRVERALRQHQYQDRERIRAAHANPGVRRVKSV